MENIQTMKVRNNQNGRNKQNHYMIFLGVFSLLVLVLQVPTIWSVLQQEGYLLALPETPAPTTAPTTAPTERVPSGYLFNGTAIFLEKAKSRKPITDKVTTHTYEIMYGTHLLPYYHQHPKMKMLEIGLGCDMNYGPGASTWLWKELFPEAELWEAEFDGRCVERSKAKGQLEGFQTLVGDQGDPKVLDQWIQESKGNFDVIIDDGGHTQCQIWTSFEKLWPTVKPGGLYFIEDLQVANRPGYMKSSPTCDGSNLIVPNKLKEILDQLVYMDRKPRSGIVEFLYCQPEACVIKKRP